MAIHERKTRCAHCDSKEDHLGVCPIKVGTPKAMAEWQAGWDYGYEDNYLASWQVLLYSAQFQLGYRLGKDEIDRLVERAYLRNCGYEYDDYDEE